MILIVLNVLLKWAGSSRKKNMRSFFGSSKQPGTWGKNVAVNISSVVAWIRKNSCVKPGYA